MKKLDIPYAWSLTSDKPGPKVVISGGIHGNETPGIEAVYELLSIMEKVKLNSGELVITLGNIPAIGAGVRGINNVDLNRCFGEEIHMIDGKPSYEHKRAQELKKAWKGADVLIDLHSTIKPVDKAFLLIPNFQNHTQYLPVIEALGVNTLFTGAGIFTPDGKAVCTDTFMDTQGAMGVTIEAGWTEDPAIDNLTERVINALKAIGVLEGEPEDLETKLELWNAHRDVTATEGFTFTQQWENLQKISAGTVLATDNNGEILVNEDSIILFPKENEHLVIGNSACTLAKEL